jgi:energy-coupling factor transporter ATP-binding protein EcfA2
MPRIVELALYGIRHVQSMTRLAFGPGLNVLSGGVGTGKSTLCEIIAVLLSPELTDRFRPFIHPHHPERAQAAVVFQADDGAFYRVIRDFVKNRINLSKIESPGQTAGGLPPLASDAPSVKTELERLFHGLTGEQIARQWLFSPARLSPATPPTVLPTTGVSPNGSAYARSSAHSPAARPPAANSRLEELKHALVKAEETQALDEQVMAAQDRVISLKQKLTKVAQVTDEREALQSELHGFPGFDQLPAGYVSLIEGLAERERTLHSHLDDKRARLQELEGDRTALTNRPIFQQRLFQIGVGLIGLAILVALFVNLPGLFRFVFPALLVPGIGILVWSVVADMRIQSTRSTLDGKIKALNQEQEVAEKQFAREQRPALELLTQTKCESVEQFKERARNVNRLHDQIERLEQEHTQLLGGQTAEQLQQQLQIITEEARALEERMRESASIAAKTGMGDVASLQAEIARLEAGGAVSADLEYAEITGAEAPPISAQTAVPPALTWLEALRAAWPHDHPALQTAISTLFSKLSGGGYGKAEWSNGRLHIQTKEQRDIDPELLSSGQRDLLAVTCFLAPWLAARAGTSSITLGRFPLLLDDPFLSLEPSIQSAFMQLLRSLGAAQQILLATHLPVPDHAGDHRIAWPIAAASAASVQAAQVKTS